jgi:hypothetical protein
MLEVKIFGRQDCDACKSTRAKFETFATRWQASDKMKILFFDMETVDGLAEGAFHGAHKVPTTIIEQNGTELARWDGKVPLSEEFKQYFEVNPAQLN